MQHANTLSYTYLLPWLLEKKEFGIATACKLYMSQQCEVLLKTMQFLAESTEVQFLNNGKKETVHFILNQTLPWMLCSLLGIIS